MFIYMEPDLESIEEDLTDDEINARCEMMEERREIDAEIMAELGVEFNG